MRRWMHWLGLIALIAFAARPLIALSFFDSDDGLLHLLRAFAFDQTLWQGVVHPCWLGDLAFGLGYWSVCP